MELYGENEHIISSDEYSDDDDDALMNDAVIAQDQNRCNYNYQNNQPKWSVDQKQKELSSLIRRNKISVIYKNKAIKWLNNKWQRERYKERTHANKENAIGQINSTNIVALEQLTQNFNKSDVHKCTQSNNDLIFYKAKNKELIDGKSNIRNVTSTNTQSTNPEQVSGGKKADERITIPEKNSQDIEQFITFVEKAGIISGKRTRTASSPILNESTESDVVHNAKKFRADSNDFYKSINDIFPKFDKITTNYIDTIANTLLTVVEDQMKKLSNEINTLNEVLQSKEMEWKRLSHLKMVKEEIHSRLKKKKYIVQLKESFSNKRNQNILLELKELEYYLSENKEAVETNNSSITIKKLIENRANMNADDLKREKNNTSRLHSLLVSQNVLHAAESSENYYTISNGEKNNFELTRKKCEMYNQLKGGTTNRIAHIYNRDRQGAMRDVESLTLDFRQKNQKLLPLVGKHKSTESTAQHLGYTVPQYAKVSRSQLFEKDHRSELFSLPNSIDEISITPIGCSKKVSSSHDVANMNNHCYSRLEDSFSKRQSQRQFNGKCPKNLKNPLCQQCKIKESRFVCAGCGNQWYCSKKCQIAAWDKHSEVCTE